jgi:hypothetical protein
MRVKSKAVSSNGQSYFSEETSELIPEEHHESESESDHGGHEDSDSSHEEDEAGHVHYIDPHWDGNCVGCVTARRVYCLDGQDPYDYS